MSISFPVTDFEVAGAQVIGVVDDAGQCQQARYSRKILGGKASLLYGAGATAKVEASLPKVLGGDNVQPLRTDDATDVLRAMFGGAQRHVDVTPGHRFEASKVTRLDAVRDFEGVRLLSHLMDGLAMNRPPAKSKTKRYRDQRNGGAETLTVGTATTWLTRLYDKHRESAGVAPVGQVRTEAQLRDRALTSRWAGELGASVRAVDDLDDRKLWTLAQASFQRVGWDRRVEAMAEVVNLVMGVEGLTPRERRDLWAWLTMRPLGGDPAFSRNIERKYARLAGALGVTVGASVSELPRATVRLDFESGREVVDVEAA